MSLWLGVLLAFIYMSIIALLFKKIENIEVKSGADKEDS